MNGFKTGPRNQPKQYLIPDSNQSLGRLVGTPLRSALLCLGSAAFLASVTATQSPANFANMP